MKKTPINPGEWQVDKYGKRYRMIGNVKEYEMELNGVPQSVFLASQRAQKERDKAYYAEEKRKAAERAASRRYCPFKDGAQTDCTREDCAMYVDGCTLARLTDRPPARDTEGLRCPFSRYSSKCRRDCALFMHGCTLTGKIKGSEDKNYE